MILLMCTPRHTVQLHARRHKLDLIALDRSVHTLARQPPSSQPHARRLPSSLWPALSLFEPTLRINQEQPEDQKRWLRGPGFCSFGRLRLAYLTPALAGVSRTWPRWTLRCGPPGSNEPDPCFEQPVPAPKPHRNKQLRPMALSYRAHLFLCFTLFATCLGHSLQTLSSSLRLAPDVDRILDEPNWTNSRTLNNRH